jgi:regulator of ribonuclease activity B
MSRVAAALLTVLAACLPAGASCADLLESSLTRGELEDRLTELRAAKTLNVDSPLEWQFVFLGRDSRGLEALSVRLVNDGYRIVSLHAAQQGAMRLRVARIEQHTPATLERRNRELGEIASGYNGTEYVGVEPAPAH